MCLRSAGDQLDINPNPGRAYTLSSGSAALLARIAHAQFSFPAGGRSCHWPCGQGSMCLSLALTHGRTAALQATLLPCCISVYLILSVSRWYPLSSTYQALYYLPAFPWALLFSPFDIFRTLALNMDLPQHIPEAGMSADPCPSCSVCIHWTP